MVEHVRQVLNSNDLAINTVVEKIFHLRFQDLIGWVDCLSIATNFTSKLLKFFKLYEFQRSLKTGLENILRRLSINFVNAGSPAAVVLGQSSLTT